MGDEKITRSIASILAARQAELGLSLRQIEEISGVTRMSASRVLAGESAIPLDKFEAVARALGLIPWQVMREAEQSLDEQKATVLEMPTTQAAQEEADDELPDFTQLAARTVSRRPGWDASQVGTDAGEEPQD